MAVAAYFRQAFRVYWVAKIDCNAARDMRVQRKLRWLGWRMLVLWECQTAAAKRERLSERIVRFLAD